MSGPGSFSSPRWMMWASSVAPSTSGTSNTMPNGSVRAGRTGWSHVGRGGSAPSHTWRPQKSTERGDVASP